MTSREFRKFEKLKLNNDRYDKYIEYTNEINKYELLKIEASTKFISKYRLSYYEEGKAILDLTTNPAVLRICLKDEDCVTEKDVMELIELFTKMPLAISCYSTIALCTTSPIGEHTTDKTSYYRIKHVMLDALNTDAKIENYNKRIKELRQMIKEL